MTQELLYTSAPRGLKPGSSGFCTVVCTQGMAVNLAGRLESLSGYRHVYQPQDSNAHRNPVVYSHLLLSVGRQPYHVLSRIAAAGLDYTQRTNKIAHHLVLEPGETPPAGPAWTLLPQQGLMETQWDGQARVLPVGRKVPRIDASPAVCAVWQSLTGDAGWGGVLAETALATPARPAVLIFRPGQDLLPLVAESLALLPPDVRWRTTFSTYYTKLPVGVDCQWRCLLEGSPELAALRRTPQLLVLDLRSPLGAPPPGQWTEVARTGVVPQLPQVRKPTLTPAPRAEKASDKELDALMPRTAADSAPTTIEPGDATPYGVRSTPPPVGTAGIPGLPPALEPHVEYRRKKSRSTLFSGIAIAVVLIAVALWQGYRWMERTMALPHSQEIAATSAPSGDSVAPAKPSPPPPDPAKKEDPTKKPPVESISPAPQSPAKITPAPPRAPNMKADPGQLRSRIVSNALAAVDAAEKEVDPKKQVDKANDALRYWFEARKDSAALAENRMDLARVLIRAGKIRIRNEPVLDIARSLPTPDSTTFERPLHSSDWRFLGVCDLDLVCYASFRDSGQLVCRPPASSATEALPANLFTLAISVPRMQGSDLVTLANVLAIPEDSNERTHIQWDRTTLERVRALYDLSDATLRAAHISATYEKEPLGVLQLSTPYRADDAIRCPNPTDSREPRDAKIVSLGTTLPALSEKACDNFVFEINSVLSGGNEPRRLARLSSPFVCMARRSKLQLDGNITLAVSLMLSTQEGGVVRLKVEYESGIPGSPQLNVYLRELRARIKKRDSKDRIDVFMDAEQEGSKGAKKEVGVVPPIDMPTHRATLSEVVALKRQLAADEKNWNSQIAQIDLDNSTEKNPHQKQLRLNLKTKLQNRLDQVQQYKPEVEKLITTLKQFEQGILVTGRLCMKDKAGAHLALAHYPLRMPEKAKK